MRWVLLGGWDILLSSVSSPSIHRPLYNVGDAVFHSAGGGWGLVLDVDMILPDSGSLDLFSVLSHTHKSLPLFSYRPFYWVLVTNESDSSVYVIYATEEDLQVDEEGRLLQCPRVMEYFTQFRKGNFL